MGHFSVVLELAVFKFVEADKALGVVLQLDENPLGRHAADDAGVALPPGGPSYTRRYSNPRRSVPVTARTSVWEDWAAAKDVNSP